MHFEDNDKTFDAEDGYDAVESVSTLTGSDGQVGPGDTPMHRGAFGGWPGTISPSLKAIFASGMVARLLKLNFGVFETAEVYMGDNTIALTRMERRLLELLVKALHVL